MLCYDEKSMLLQNQIIKIINQQYEKPTFNSSFKGTFQESANYYYKEARNLYIANIVLNNQLKNINEERRFLEERLDNLNRNLKDSQEESKPKRIRKCASEIVRNFKCSFCPKAYGSEGSLSQHIKLKHPEAMKNPLQIFKKEDDQKQ